MNDWLAGLLTSRTRTALLTHLLRDDARPLGTREIARVTGCDYRSVWQELERLEDLGLVRSTREGRSRRWRANTDHPLHEHLETLIRAAAALDASDPPTGSVPAWLQPLLVELSDQLRSRFGRRFVGLWLYGSQARGDATDESDVDLLLRLASTVDPSAEIDRIADLLADLNLRTGVLLSVIPIEEAQFDRAAGPFWEAARREGVAA